MQFCFAKKITIIIREIKNKKSGRLAFFPLSNTSIILKALLEVLLTSNLPTFKLISRSKKEGFDYILCMYFGAFIHINSVKSSAPPYYYIGGVSYLEISSQAQLVYSF